MKQPIIALITDFGEADFFVASLKAVILRINPAARIVDITHQVSSFNICQGSFILFSCYKYFPEKTIFLAVVDPGVGSSRRIILVKTKKYFFIGPDNGVLSLPLEHEDVLEIWEVSNERYFLENRSNTFDGRDKMSPVAAWLSNGTPCREFGSQIKDFKKLGFKRPELRKNGISGSIIYEDKFGNLITNIPVEMMNQLKTKLRKENLTLTVKNEDITTFKANYSHGNRGELFFLVGSTGLIEIATNKDAASRLLKAKIGDRIILQ